MQIWSYVIAGISTFSFCCLIYFSCNKSLVPREIRQQIRRFGITTIIIYSSLFLCNANIFSVASIPIWANFFLWSISFPLLFNLTNRKSATEYQNYMDIVFALYLFGICQITLAATTILPVLARTIILVVLGIVEASFAIIPICHFAYFLLYKTCLDANGMKILQETHYNEIIEYIKSFNPLVSALIFILLFGVFASCIVANSTMTEISQTIEITKMISAFILAGLIFYTFKKKHGVFTRTGLAELFLVVKDYSETNNKYQTQQEERIKNLQVSPLKPHSDKPSTIFLVIGESASKDYMSAFTEMEQETTPWMNKCRKDDNHFLFFDHSYSCASQTVPVLERALTEKNQYNDKEFYESCSIIDVAHKLGYKVHWYSNQGHLGAADTPITLVANTADVVKWTKQELNTVQYDESLVDFLDEVDPNKNNFVVLHLKGNHFNFINRYPADRTVFGKPGEQDAIINYINSIHYTDSVLQKFYEYGTQKLNLQAMLFFSDHACIPDKRRTPNFNGFGLVRIPMFFYASDEFIKNHPERYAALQQNIKNYFTNDLIYELQCGIFDIKSNHFDESNSFASTQYKYKREILLTNEGATNICEDSEN